MCVHVPLHGSPEKGSPERTSRQSKCELLRRTDQLLERKRELERERGWGVGGGLIVLYTDNRHSIFSISLGSPSNSEQERETDEKRESRAQKGLQMLVIHLSRVA